GVADGAAQGEVAEVDEAHPGGAGETRTLPVPGHTPDRLAPAPPAHQADAREENAARHRRGGETVPLRCLPDEPGDGGECRDQEGEHAEPHRGDMDVEEAEPDTLQGIRRGGERHPEADQESQTRQGEPDSDAGHVLASSNGPATATDRKSTRL